jgi:acyl-CoA thioester hydrolase
MGYVYYGNYAEYLEVARVEALRELGISYKDMEDEGFVLPVLDFHIKYIRPAYYDDMITIHTTIPKIPGARIFFEYEMYNQEGVLLNKAETTLVFINRTTGKPCPAPQDFLDKISPFYSPVN